MTFTKEMTPWNKGKKTGLVPKSAFKKGFTPWNKGKVGMVSSFKGKHHTDEAKEKNRLAHLGKTSKTKGIKRGKNIKLSIFMTGRKLSEETKRKISLSNSGKNSHRWKGGITSQDRLERVKFRIKIQKLVFERDGYKCTKCGEGGNLQVDHIQPWSEYVELRFDMNNCRTLCSGCHYELTFGRPMPKDLKGWGHNLIERVRITT